VGSKISNELFVWEIVSAVVELPAWEKYFGAATLFSLAVNNEETEVGKKMSECINPILKQLMYALSIFKEISHNDICVGVCDREKYLLYIPSVSLPLKIDPGTAVKSGTSLRRAMEERKRVVIRGDKAIFGFPYVAIAIPIINEASEVIGAAVATASVDLEENIREMANTLNSSLSLMSSTSEQLSAQSQEIAGVSRELLQTYHSSTVKFKDTDQMLTIIRNVASQTNLLGLNAAIEAARVGELGRGFSVVAAEIRKLSDSTSESIKHASQVISTIQKENTQNQERFEYMEMIIAQVAEAVSHLAETVQETSTLAVKLNDLADKLS